MDLAERHPVIGDIRGTGLHQVIEIVKNRETREPMSEFNKPFSEPMAKAAKSLKANGIERLRALEHDLQHAAADHHRRSASGRAERARSSAGIG